MLNSLVSFFNNFWGFLVLDQLNQKFNFIVSNTFLGDVFSIHIYLLYKLLLFLAWNIKILKIENDWGQTFFYRGLQKITWFDFTKAAFKGNIHILQTTIYKTMILSVFIHVVYITLLLSIAREAIIIQP